jgi:hypothetical protein
MRRTAFKTAPSAWLAHTKLSLRLSSRCPQEWVVVALSEKGNISTRRIEDLKMRMGGGISITSLYLS